MAIRLSGMNSGLDTDSIVKALVSSYSYRKETIEKKQTKLDWTRDTWKSLNTKTYSFYSGISSMRFSSTYNMRKTSVSDATKATVTTSNDAVNGTQTLNILKTAQAGYMTGGKLANGVSKSTTMAELGFVGDDAQINVDKGDGTSKTITIKSTDTIDNVITQLKDAGLNASLDTGNSRMFVSSKETGADNDFNLIGANANGYAALSALGLNTSLTTKDAEGNDVDTATATAYKRYGTFAMTDDGSVITDESVIADKIKASLTEYKEASATAKAAEAQIANLKSATNSYAKAYTDLQDALTQYSSVLSDSDDTLAALAKLSESTRSSAVIGEDGKTYTKIAGSDKDSNPVYAYKKDGVSEYVSKVTTYTDTEGQSYTKQSDGTYKGTNAAGEEVTYSGDTADLKENVKFVNTTERLIAKVGEKEYDIQTRQVDGEDGNTTTEYYFVTDDGEEYTGKTATGSFTYKDAEGKTKTATGEYSYVPSEEVATGVKDATSLYEEYASKLTESYGLSEEDAKKALDAYTANYATVTAYESAATEETGTYAYSKQNIVDAVHDAYGDEQAMSDLLKGYSTKVSELSASLKSAQTTIDNNSVVAGMENLEEGSTEYNEVLSKMVTSAQQAANILTSSASGNTAVKVDGSDAIIKLNGVTYTNSSNSITVNGLTVNAMAVTGDGDENAISITTATDVQGIYDKIKDFLTDYNSLINEMTKLYNADSAKGYEPLTDDEKDAMSDSEVEKWETKIKDALLRNDQTLSGLITSMSSAMSSSYEVDGKKFNLSSFGISTLGYLNANKNEQNAYHIDGDEDDASTSGNTDKLMKAISENPEEIMEFFQKLSSSLYDTLGSKMKGSSLSSAYTIYNDKQLDTQYKQYTKLISEWEDKISDKEDYYYNKFTSMETAMAKLNSTQSQLSGYFG